MINHKPRFEFRNFDYRDDDIRFRYEFRVEAPRKLTIGLTYKPTDNIKLKLGHRWLTQKIGNILIHRHVISTGVMLFY